MQQSRICAYEKCKKEFIPRTGRQIHCCDTCQIKKNMEKRVAQKKKARQSGAKTAPPAPKKKRPKSALTVYNEAARAAGMTYGVYVGKTEGVKAWKLKKRST